MKISTPLMDLLNSNAFKKIKDDYDVVSNNILNDGFMRQGLINTGTKTIVENIFKPLFQKNSFGDSISSYNGHPTWTENIFDGMKIKYNDLDYYIYLFGLPINLKRINGLYLLKLAQMRFPVKYLIPESNFSIQYPFKGNVQFARLFVLYYAICIILKDNSPTSFQFASKINNKPGELIAYNMVLDAFSLMFIKYYILDKFAKIVRVDKDKIMYFQLNIPLITQLFSDKLGENSETIKKISEYQQKNPDGHTLQELAIYLYCGSNATLSSKIQNLTLKFAKYLAQISDHINLQYIQNGQQVGSQWGFCIPNLLVYQYNYDKYSMYKLQYDLYSTGNDNSSKYNITLINNVSFYVTTGGSVTDAKINQINDVNLSEIISPNQTKYIDTKDGEKEDIVDTETYKKDNTVDQTAGKLTIEDKYYYFSIGDPRQASSYISLPLTTNAKGEVIINEGTGSGQLNIGTGQNQIALTPGKNYTIYRGPAPSSLSENTLGDLLATGFYFQYKGNAIKPTTSIQIIDG